MRVRHLATLSLLAAAPLAAQQPGGLKRTNPWVDVAGGIFYHREPLLDQERAESRIGPAGLVRVGRRMSPASTSHYVLSVQYGRSPDATALPGTTRLGYTSWAVSGGIENDTDFGPFLASLGIELGWGSFREAVTSGAPVPPGTNLNSSANLAITPTVTLRDRFRGPVHAMVQARFTQVVQGFGRGGSPFRPFYVVGLSLGR